MKLLYLTITAIILMFFQNCGFNGNQKITQEGESITKLVLELGFIEDINLLCQQSINSNDFLDEEGYNQAVAECTLDNLSVLQLDINAIDEVVSTLCDENADLSQLTPEERLEVERACSTINF